MGIVSVALRKARSATTFSAFEISLVLPVFVLLGVARLAVLTVPFRIYGRHLGREAPLDTVTVAVSTAQMARTLSIARVVRRTAKITPWASLCLPQAMVSALLLRLADIPYCAIFGLAPNTDAASDNLMEAHAWVRVEDVNVTGGQDVSRYTIVKVFQRMSRSPR